MQPRFLYEFFLFLSLYFECIKGPDSSGPYTIRIMPAALFLQSGENSILRCEVETAADAAAPTRLVWEKKGAASLPQDIVDNGDGTLTFKSASLEMSGEYLCKTEGLHTPASATSVVNVLHKVEVDYYITVDPQSLDLEEGKVGQLSCQIETPPGAAEPGIVWLWNGSENLPYGVFDNRRGTLKFREAKTEQSGTYTCQTDTESLSKAEAIVSIKASKGRQLFAFSSSNILTRMPQQQI